MVLSDDSNSLQREVPVLLSEDCPIFNLLYIGALDGAGSRLIVYYVSPKLKWVSTHGPQAAQKFLHGVRIGVAGLQYAQITDSRPHIERFTTL